SDYGASCIDCHSPDGWKHEIRSYTDPKSASHPDNLAESCGQSNCHGYTKKPGNEGFTLTDMHDVSLLGIKNIDQPKLLPTLADSKWFWASGPFILVGLFFAIASLIWWLLYRNTKKIIPIVGGTRFEQVMIGRKPKRKKAAAKKPAKPRAKPATVIPEKKSDDGAAKVEPATAPKEPEKSVPAADEKADKPAIEKTVKVDEKPTKPDNDSNNSGA
ncbi:MAG: hypothetical protein GQ582_13405, partial [Methyloprofundus sp.]|nr:hypothetical protein [Methyloprofundus sp.]